MKTKLILFKHFKEALPNEFLRTVTEICPDALMVNANENTEFNRWDISYRFDSRILKAIEITNTKHKGILTNYFNILSLPQDRLSGFIECDDSGFETWNK